MNNAHNFHKIDIIKNIKAENEHMILHIMRKYFSKNNSFFSMVERDMRKCSWVRIAYLYGIDDKTLQYADIEELSQFIEITEKYDLSLAPMDLWQLYNDTSLSILTRWVPNNTNMFEKSKLKEYPHFLSVREYMLPYLNQDYYYYEYHNSLFRKMKIDHDWLMNHYKLTIRNDYITYPTELEHKVFIKEPDKFQKWLKND